MEAWGEILWPVCGMLPKRNRWVICGRPEMENNTSASRADSAGIGWRVGSLGKRDPAEEEEESLVCFGADC